MASANLGRISVMIADPDEESRFKIVQTLKLSNITDIRQGGTLAFIRSECQKMMPELLISETKLPDGDFTGFMTDLRHHKFGHNPFLNVTAITANPTPDLVRGIITAGADDLLTKPLSMQALLERIGVLINNRRPFIVTSDYVGPVRPAKSQREKDSKPMVVPNTLKTRVTTLASREDMQKQIDATIRQVNTQKLEAHAEHIVELVDMLVPNLGAGRMGATAKLAVDRLLFVSEDAARRLGGTPYDHVSDLCLSLLKVVNNIATCGGEPEAKDIKLLSPLSKAIQLGFVKGADIGMAREISKSIGQ